MASFLGNLKKALKPETYTAMLEEVGDEFDWSVIPYSRFSAVVNERNTLRDKIADLEENDAKADPDKKFTQTDIDTAVAAKETELKASFDAERAGLKVRDAALEKLRKEGALDAELIYESSKFNKDKLKLDKDGKVEGLDDLVTAFKTEHANLFGEAEGAVQTGTGKKGGDNPQKKDSEVDGALDSMFNMMGGFFTPIDASEG